MRAGVFLEALSTLGDVDVVAIAPKVMCLPAMSYVREYARRVIILDTEGKEDTLYRMAASAPDPQQGLAIFKQYGLPSASARVSAPIRRELTEVLDSRGYDLTLISRSYLLPVVDGLKERGTLGELVIDLDDDDVAINLELAGVAENEGNNSRNTWLQQNANAYARLIEETCSSADLIIAASATARNSIADRSRLTGLEVLVNGVEVPDLGSREAGTAAVFVGNLTYEPNRSGVLWFINEVLPRIRCEIPEQVFHVGGSGPEAAIKDLFASAGVRLTANPSNLHDVYNQAAIAVVPLFAGSGSRIKILEAGAQGVPVVSTRKGAEGLDLESGKHLWIAGDDPDEFARVCLEALRSKLARRSRAAYLWRHVNKHHNRNSVVARAAKRFASLL